MELLGILVIIGLLVYIDLAKKVNDDQDPPPC